MHRLLHDLPAARHPLDHPGRELDQPAPAGHVDDVRGRRAPYQVHDERLSSAHATHNGSSGFNVRLGAEPRPRGRRQHPVKADLPGRD